MIRLVIAVAIVVRIVLRRCRPEKPNTRAPESDAVPLAGPEIENPDAVQGLRFLQRHGEVLEQIDALNQHVVSVRDEDLPVLRAGIALRRGHDLEILGVLVGANVEETFAMVDVVAVLLFARQKHA